MNSVQVMEPLLPEVDLAKLTEDLRRHWSKLIVPPPIMTVSQWADAKRYVPPEENPTEPGKWRTSRAEYQRGMMDAFSDPRVNTVVFYTSAGVGKTSMLENVLGYYMDYDPCPILFVEPTEQDARDWSKDFLTPMIRDTPCLRMKVHEAKAKRTDNTIVHKKFPGGYLKAVGANSPRGFRRITARVVLLDEPDGYPPSAGPEGDPLGLAKKRTRNLWNKKIGIASTPTLKDISRIEQEWELSNKQHYYVPCPLCGFFQVLIFGPKSQFAGLAQGYLKINGENPAASVYVCGNCSAELTESHKFWMVARGQWRATAPSVTGVSGFHINELYSTFSTWESITREWLGAKNHREKLRTFINTTLGETWDEPDALTVTETMLAGRIEKYTGCPMGVLVLTAAVDVQVDRLECKVKGWGLNSESWLIDLQKFYGSPDAKETWQLVDDYLLTEFPHESGIKLRIQRVFVDSGFKSDEVYQFTGPRRRRGIYATKGFGGAGKPLIGKISRAQSYRKGALLVPIGVDDAKKTVYDRLEVQEPGPLYMHLNQMATDDYLKQLTAEKQITKYTRDGVPERVWVRRVTGSRNEALDMEVMNLAAISFLNANMTVLARKQAERVKAIEALPADVPAVRPETVTVSGRPRIRINRRWKI